MAINRRFRSIFCVGAVLLLGAAGAGQLATAALVPAVHRQGSSHAFLLLKTSDGRIIGHGDMVSLAKGDQVRSRLTLHFRDGSLDDETTVMMQHGALQLVSDHHIQKGPSFPKPIDVTIAMPTGDVTSREWKDGKEQVTTEHMDLPQDLSNGMTTAVLLNIPPKSPETKVSYLAAAPKPRLVTLLIKPAGQAQFEIGGVPHPADRSSLHIDLGGVASVIAPVIGKQPSDIMVWVTRGEVPSVLKMEGALYIGGPIWTMELASPVWGAGK